MECVVCCEKFNKTTRASVTCGCGFVACMTCVKRYVLNNSAGCMKCQRPWDYEFMFKNLPRAFVMKEYKEHRKQMLFSIEKSKLALSQPKAEAIIEKRKCFTQRQTLKEEISKKRRLLRKYLDADESQVIANLENDEFIQKVKEAQMDVALSEVEDEFLRIRISHATNIINSGADRAVKKTYARKCPENDCQGFLNSLFECPICECKLCRTCGVIECRKDEKGKTKHECKKEDIDTFMLLQRETKPCPKCGMPVMKIDGCPQVWVMCCKIAFNYNTGEIVHSNQRIHAPDYYRYLREHNVEIPREPQDIVGGCIDGEVDIHSFRTMHKRRNMMYNYATADETISEIYRKYHHIADYELEKLGRAVHNEQRNDNDDLRVKLLLKDIDEEAFKTQIQIRERVLNKNAQLFSILQTYANSFRDVLLYFQRECVPFVSKLEERQRFINGRETFCKMFNSLQDFVTENLNTYDKDFACSTFKLRNLILLGSYISTNIVFGNICNPELKNNIMKNIIDLRGKLSTTSDSQTRLEINYAINRQESKLREMSFWE